MILLLFQVKTINGYLQKSLYLSKPCGAVALEANAVLITPSRTHSVMERR
jgi:hypothetical protein